MPELNVDIETLADRNGGYWGEHARYSVSAWQQEVENGDTRAGHWNWVHAQIEQED